LQELKTKNCKLKTLSMINEQKRRILIIFIALALIIAAVFLVTRRKGGALPSENLPQPGQGEGLTPAQKEEILKELAPKKGEENKGALTPEQKSEIIQQLAPPPASVSKDGQATPAPKGLTPEQKKKILDALTPKK